MQQKSTPWATAILYLIALVGCCIGMTSGPRWLEYLCKPLLMIVLSIWFFRMSRQVGDRFTLLVQTGLFFSLVGDVALMFQELDDFNFLIGLSAFFIAQLCYAFAFADNVLQVGGMEGFVVSILLSFVLGTFAFFFTLDLLPRVDEDLRIPVVAYSSAISLMGIMAAFRYRRTYRRSFLAVLIGSFLFIASDSLLAYNRFSKPFSWAPIAIMVTYAAAQVLIASGCLMHVLDPDNLRRREALST